MKNLEQFPRQPEEVPPAPQALGKIAREWRQSVIENFEFEPHHFSILDIAAEALDRRLQARKILKKEGLTTTDSKGVTRPHPCVSIERDSAIRFLRAMRELNLDVPAEESRPPSLRQPFAGRRKF